jgi:lysophospholipase L1-like esterase
MKCRHGTRQKLIELISVTFIVKLQKLNVNSSISYLRRAAVAILMVLCFNLLYAQQEKAPFYNDVQAFRKIDSVHKPAPNQILFIGSSSFTKWRGVQDSFPQYKIVNRAFGGSTFTDLLRYADQIIFPYKPKQIVIYCGDNDLASSDNITPDSVLSRFQSLFILIRSKLPRANIAFVSIKPSPSRAQLMPKMEAANKLIREYLRKKSRTAYIDVYNKMLVNGEPMSDIFVEDKLHMNEKGYAIWTAAIGPYLKK